MNAALLQLFSRLNAFPGCGHLDQHAVNVNALGLVQLDEAFTPRECGIGIKTQARIDLGGHSAWHSRQNFTAKAYQQTVHHFIDCPAPELAHDAGQQRCVIRLLDRLQDQ